MRQRLFGVVVFLLFISEPPIWAKTKPSPPTTCEKLAKGTPAFSYCDQLSALVAEPPSAIKTRDARQLATFWVSSQRMPAAFSYSMFSAFLARLEASRLDNQTGTTNANGSTNLVSLPGTTDFLSAAVGVGALTQSTSGTTTTVTGNVAGIASSFSSPHFDFSSSGIPFLRDLAVSGSFVVNPGTPTTVPTSGPAATANPVPSMVAVNTSSAQFNGVGVRYARFNKFDPQSAQFQDTLKTVILANTPATLDGDDVVTKALIVLQAPFLPLGNTDAAHAAQTQLESDTDLLKAIEDFNNYFRTVQTQVDTKGSSFRTNLTAFAQAMQGKLNLYRETIETASGVPAFTFEYTYSRPASQLETHDFRLIGAWNFGGNMLTTNGAATIYGTLPANATFGHFKDAQVSMQADFPLGGKGGNQISKVDFSVAGYGQYQQSPSILNVSASDIPSGLNLVAGAPAFISGTQGWLGVVQAKLTIKGGNGVQIVPISYKWSNHTELFAQSSSTLQFGLSVDLSSLSQLTGAR